MALQNSDQPDASQEVLRVALSQAAKLVSIKQILDLAAGSDRGRLFSERALRDFINGETKSISKANYDLLAAAWLHTPLGRALRNLDAEAVPAFDQLMGKLADGDINRPAGVAVAGSYFMYHGSYLLPGHFVVRVVTVTAEDDHILTVTDTIRDDKTLGVRDRAASGVMIFVDGQPQILLFGDENKRGLSLVIGSETDVQGGALDQVFGAFIVMRARGGAAYRHCLMIREADGNPQAMLAETGIFPEPEIKAPERAKHRRAFDLLKRLTVNEPFADPISGYGELQ